MAHNKVRELNLQWLAWGLPTLSGILVLLSFPTWSYDYLVWIAIVPLLLALDGKTPGASFVVAYLAGLCFFGGVLANVWTGAVQSLTTVHFSVLALYLSIYWGVWGWAVSLLQRTTTMPLWLIAPPLWVVQEFARAHAGFVSYPWLYLGHTQYSHITLSQMVSLTGIYGLTFQIVLVNAGVVELLLALRRQPGNPLLALRLSIKPLLLSLVLISWSMFYGYWILSSAEPSQVLRIAVIQANISPSQKWNRSAWPEILDRYADWTRKVSRQSPTLIVWPETAVPGDVVHDVWLKSVLGNLAREVNAFLFVGSSEHTKFGNRQPFGNYFNSMVLFSPEGDIEGTYKKTRLVPFAEYVPLKEHVTWPGFLMNSMGDSVPGNDYPVFKVGGVSIGTTICWETIFPDVFRQFVQQGASLMIAATDEGWFGKTVAPYHLVAITVYRAIENHVAVVRSANTGLSAFIDPYGRIIQSVRGHNDEELFVEGSLVLDLPISHAGTFYTRFGDVFAYFLILSVFLFVALAIRRQVFPLRVKRVIPCAFGRSEG